MTSTEVPDELTHVHALTGVHYVIREAGRVIVTLEGRSGTYDGVGRWLDGDHLPVDPQICRWLDSGWLTRGRWANRRYTTDALTPDQTQAEETRTEEAQTEQT